MSYQTVLHTPTKTYILEFLVDLANEITTDHISFSIYDAILSNQTYGILSSEDNNYYQKTFIKQNFQPYSTNTDNVDKDDYQLALSNSYLHEDALAISLYKESLTHKVNFDTGILEEEYTSSKIQSNILVHPTDGEYLYTSCDASGRFDVYLLQYPVFDFNYKSKRKSFSEKTTYNIKIDLSKLLLNETLGTFISSSPSGIYLHQDNVETNTEIFSNGLYLNNLYYTKGTYTTLNVSGGYASLNNGEFKSIVDVKNGDNLKLKVLSSINHCTTSIVSFEYPNDSNQYVTTNYVYQNTPLPYFQSNLTKEEWYVKTKPYDFSFITSIASSTIYKSYNKYPNNILTSLNKLDLIKDIDNILNLNEELNYEFSTDNNLLQFDVNTTLEQLYINQYLSEYTKYFEVIVNENILTKQEIINLKKILLKNSNLVNATFKGNLNGMSIIVDIFCKALGYFLLNLELSPLLNNFIYRITTSLPKEYWLGNVKNIIHPVSWKDEYIYVDVKSSYQNIWYDSYKKVVPKEYTLSYLDVSNKPRYHMYPNIFDLSIFEDYHSHHKFNFNLNEYTAEVNQDNEHSGYNNQNLLDILNDNKLYISSSITGDYNRIEVDVEYTFLGVALEYEFKVLINTNEYEYQNVSTYFPYIHFSLPYSCEDFKIQVVLKNKGFAYAITSDSIIYNLLDDINNFTSVLDGNIATITYSINEFFEYKWILYDISNNIIHEELTHVSYIQFDMTVHECNSYQLTLVYNDGFEKLLTKLDSNLIGN